jgi:alkylhydroperoxidase family enzyme
MRISVPEANASAPQAYVATHYATAILSAAKGFSRAVYEHTTLSLREFEGARARTAEINGCQLCLNWRSKRDVPGFLKSIGSTATESIADHGPEPDEAFYQQVSEWRTATIYSERERIAIEYAEKVGLDPHALAVDDDFWSRAKAVFDDNAIVDLAYCVAQWMGLGRVAHVLGLDDVCALPAPPRREEIAA